MNTSTADMDYLMERSPYVLAAIGNLECCPNSATAHGVFGAVEAALGGSVEGKRCVVHGCGNVGATVARLLVEHGAKEVKTVDRFTERAEIDGCTNITGDERWWTHECDALVPCSSTGLLTEKHAAELNCGYLVGATNIPFSSKRAREIAEQERGVRFVPESISSAGAVIVDSIEHYARNDFCDSHPPDLYEFTRQTVHAKANALIAEAATRGMPISQVVPHVAECPTMGPVGERFADWRKENGNGARSPPPSSSPSSPKSSGGGFGAGVRTMSTSSSSVATDSADVVVVGAGIMGLNIAYQLRRRDPKMKITVLERASALGYGSSGYSTGFQRAYYSFDETMKFALDGTNAYHNWKDYLQDADAEAKFTETGALWMLGYDKAQNDAMIDRLGRFGVKAENIDEAELGRRFPQISPEPFPTYNEEGDEVPQSLGAFSAVYEHGCGHIDSSTCLEDLLRACRRDNIEVRFNQGVEAFETSTDGAKCTGVRLAGGAVIGADVAVVNASGPWFNKLNSTVGLKLSTEALPTRIQVGHKWCPDDHCNLPFVADGWGPSGIYFMPRAANNQLVFGSVAHRFESEIVDPDNYNEALDPDVKQDYLNCLFHRLPGLPKDGEIVGFSSMYTVNQDDVHPMIGETKVGQLWACNGFSGHGFKLAPAVGSLVAQQVTGQKTAMWETNVPHNFMGPYREPLTLKTKTHFA